MDRSPSAHAGSSSREDAAVRDAYQNVLVRAARRWPANVFEALGTANETNSRGSTVLRAHRRAHLLTIARTRLSWAPFPLQNSPGALLLCSQNALRQACSAIGGQEEDRELA